MERYRSGHNEAVLKTVWLNGHVGSNPTLSANFLSVGESRRFADLPKWWRGSPAKGVGRETGARVQISQSAPYSQKPRRIAIFYEVNFFVSFLVSSYIFIFFILLQYWLQSFDVLFLSPVYLSYSII